MAVVAQELISFKTISVVLPRAALKKTFIAMGKAWEIPTLIVFHLRINSSWNWSRRAIFNIWQMESDNVGVSVRV